MISDTLEHHSMSEEVMLEKLREDLRKVSASVEEIASGLEPTLDSLASASAAVAEQMGHFYAQSANLGFLVGRFHGNEVES